VGDPPAKKAVFSDWCIVGVFLRFQGQEFKKDGNDGGIG
jgi:hypothetical protein